MSESSTRVGTHACSHFAFILDVLLLFSMISVGEYDSAAGFLLIVSTKSRENSCLPVQLRGELVMYKRIFSYVLEYFFALIFSARK